MLLRQTRAGAPGLVALSTAAMIAVAVFITHAKDDEGKEHGNEKIAIGLIGDTPYNALGRSQYPALLADINRAHVDFTIFDGDLKAGGDGPCADSLYYTARDNFN